MTTAAERLDEAMDAIGAPDDTADERWMVTDASGADWAMRKLRKARAELAEAERLATQQHEAIDAYLAAERERLAPEIGNWETRLAVWHRSILADDSDRKTIRLPAGTLTARKLPDNIEIEDEVVLLDLLMAAEKSDLIVVPAPKLDRSAIKRAVLKGGESIPGVSPVEGEIRYSVSTDVEEVEG